MYTIVRFPIAGAALYPKTVNLVCVFRSLLQSFFQLVRVTSKDNRRELKLCH